jgi:hypothetical protein
MKKIKKIKRYIFLVVVLLILLTESVLRIFYSEKYAVAYRPTVYRSLPIVNYGYVPDTCFSLFGKKHYINKQGFIGNDFGQKTTDTFRIAIVGASSVAGTINLTAYYSFCPMLQEKFTETNTKVEVLNCGIDGGGRSLELFKSINHQVVKFQPDIILLEYALPFETWGLVRENYNGYIVGYPHHDQDGKRRVKKMIDKLNSYKLGIDLLYNSYIMRVMIRYYFKKSEFKTKLSHYIELYEAKMLLLGDFNNIVCTMDESVDMLHSLKNELTEKNIKLFLFQYGRNNNVVQTAKENNLPLISLGMTFESTDYFPNDGHWNKIGNRKIAARFYEIITKYGLIPEQYLPQ